MILKRNLNNLQIMISGNLGNEGGVRLCFKR